MAFPWHSQGSSTMPLKRRKVEHFLQAAKLPTLRKKYHVASSMAGSLHSNCLGLLRDAKTSDLFFSLSFDLKKNWPAKLPFWKQQQVIQVAGSKQFSTLQKWGFMWHLSSKLWRCRNYGEVSDRKGARNCPKPKIRPETVLERNQVVWLPDFCSSTQAKELVSEGRGRGAGDWRKLSTQKFIISFSVSLFVSSNDSQGAVSVS